MEDLMCNLKIVPGDPGGLGENLACQSDRLALAKKRSHHAHEAHKDLKAFLPRQPAGICGDGLPRSLSKFQCDGIRNNPCLVGAFQQ